MHQTVKNVVIIGAGFAGLRVALRLEKKRRAGANIAITLIDRRGYQLFAPDLYEVATSPEEFTSISELSRGVCLPLAEVLKNKKIAFVQGEVKGIDQSSRTVTVGTKKLSYDYLVVATGSVTDYLGIRGAEKFSLPLKTLEDGLRVRNALEFTMQAHRLDIQKKNIRIVIAGGGFTGVELAAELSREMKVLAWKNQYPQEKIEIMLLEALPQLLGAGQPEVSSHALEALKALGVRVLFSSFVSRVEQNFLNMANGERISYDVLIWTTGVKPVRLPWRQDPEADRKGRLVVNDNLQLKADRHVFAVGDCAFISGQKQGVAPSTSWAALEEADYVAYALPLLLGNRKPKSFKLSSGAMLMTLGGQHALLKVGGWQWVGYLGYVVRVLVHIRYFSSIVGWWKAVKYVWFQARVWSRND